MTCVQTASGQMIDLLKPDPELIGIRDIAKHLSCIARFNGATNGAPYSVAQHSCVAARIAQDRRYPPLICLQALLHDAHEAFTGDIATPMKQAIASGAGHLVDVIQFVLDQEIYKALGIEMPDGTAASIIAACDESAFVAEWRDLMQGRCPPTPTNAAPARFTIRPLNWSRAEAHFLTEFERLTIAAGINPTPAHYR